MSFLIIFRFYSKDKCEIEEITISRDIFVNSPVKSQLL